MRVIVGLAGRRGCGKSTIGRRLEQEHGFAFVSFGDVVRREAVARSLPIDTPALQTLGRRLIDEWGWERFCRAVLAGASVPDKVVIEGIRHRLAVEALRGLLAPDHFRLVFIQIAEQQRLVRLRLRGRPGDSDAGTDSDSIEQEVDSLRGLAEFEVSGEDECAADLVAKWSVQTGS